MREEAAPAIERGLDGTTTEYHEMAVEGDEVKKAFAAMSGLAALGGFVMRQWMNYQRRSLKYQKALTDHIYFRNINNNAGIFDAVIGAAEDQECKEAFLAYYFLCTAASAPKQAELEDGIEIGLGAAVGAAAHGGEGAGIGAAAGAAALASIWVATML